MNPSRSEAGLGDGKTAALVAQQVPDGYAHVAVDHFGVSATVDVAEHVWIKSQFDPGRVLGHHDHGLLQVARGVGVGLAHDNEDLAPFGPGARTEPLASVQYVLVAVAVDRERDVGGVRRRRRTWRR